MKSSNIQSIANFAYSLINKFSDHFNKIIIVNDLDMIPIVEKIITLIENNLVNFTHEEETSELIQLTEKLYYIIFNLPKKDQEIFLKQKNQIPKEIFKKSDLSIFTQEKIKILSPLIKMILCILIKKISKQELQKKFFSNNNYPIIIQNGGNLYNNKLNIIYLTKQSG